jgi:putative ABC transport system permease protein
VDKDQWQEIAAVLGRNKVRTALTGFGVFWGIFMLVVMMGSGQGLQNGAEAGFGNSVKNSVFLWTQSTTIAYKGFKPGRSINMHNDDVEALRNQVSSLEVLAPRAQAGGYRGLDNVTRGVKTGAFNLYGDTPDYVKIEPTRIVQGRNINWRDIEEKRKVCFIGDQVRKTLYEEGEAVIGSYIRVQGINYKVVGLYKSMNEDPNQAEEQEKAITIPLTTFQQAYNWGEVVGWLSMAAKSNIPATEMEAEVRTVLKQRLKVHPQDDRAFGSFNKEEAFKRMTGLLTGIQVLSLIVGVLTLLAGAIGVSNIMLVIVKERTREFGVRRAIGAEPFSIVKQVILESMVLTVSAGILGIILGVWSLEGVAAIMNQSAGQSAFFRNPGVKLPIVLVAFGILVFSGILAGLIPARRAISVKPVDALRFE